MNARTFHDLTTHTPYSVRAGGHTLDWDIKPFPFKVYTDTPVVALPRAFHPIAADTLTAIAASGEAHGEASAPLTLERLATVLYLSAGVTKKKVYGQGVEVLFRAAASTGALYQTELYVAAGDVSDLAPGLYHFCPGDFTLRRLRDEDVRGALAHAAATGDLRDRAAVLIVTAIYWRNTWKYQARGFRHLFWDSGTMLANVLAASSALDLAPRLLTGFVDDEVNHVLGIDAHHETALELVALGGAHRSETPTRAAEAEAEATHELPPIAHETMPLSSSEVDYLALREMVEASKLATSRDVLTWRGGRLRGPAPPARTRRFVGTLVQLPAPRARSGRALSDTIQRRGSTREFSHAPISDEELATVLWAATRPIPADVPSGLVELFVIVNAVDGAAPGAYVYRPAPDAPAKEHALELIRAGALRDDAAYLTLEQRLGGDAAATIFFLAPLDAIIERWGERGYRLANLEAGLAGGRAYLAAYALGFGASGLTFYDRHVVEFFAPASDGLDAIFVTALGRSVRTPARSA